MSLLASVPPNGRINVTCQRPPGGWATNTVYTVDYVADMIAARCGSRFGAADVPARVSVVPTPTVTVTAPANRTICQSAQNVVLPFAVSSSVGGTLSLTASASAGVNCTVPATGENKHSVSGYSIQQVVLVECVVSQQ